MPAIVDSKVYLTTGQIEYLYHPGSKGAEGYDSNVREKEDLVILATDEEGWIFVANSKTLDEEGAGVWVDAEGYEHHSPMVGEVETREIVVRPIITVAVPTDVPREFDRGHAQDLITEILEDGGPRVRGIHWPQVRS